MTPLSFTVHGVAKPKGSAKAFVIKGTNRAVVTSDTKGLKAWEEAIRSVAIQHATRVLEGPVSVVITFFLPRPVAHAKRLGPGTPRHILRPDLDKLARAALDPLTKVVWRDDAQVATLLARKRYVEIGMDPQVQFVICEEVQ